MRKIIIPKELQQPRGKVSKKPIRLTFDNLLKFKTIRSQIAWLKKKGYPKIEELEYYLYRFRRERPYEQATRELVADFVIHDKIHPKVKREWIEKRNQIEIVKEEPIVQSYKNRTERRGMDFYNLKKKVEPLFPSSRFKLLFESASDFAKFATENEIEELCSQ